MSFLDKLFSHKTNWNKIENELKVNCEPLKSSNLYISKEQIRFLLFRECDKRGRKLLFDSNAVEKTLLLPKDLNQYKRCSLSGNKKNSDYIETTSTHGYKYKKLSDDIACLGEMIFGSVAMTYKGENSCKIHKIPSPKKLMFTTIIHAPGRCHIGAINECSPGSSGSSVRESLDQKETSSSDSKLYQSRGVSHKCSSTYPCSSHTPGLEKLIQCCEVNGGDSSLVKKSIPSIDNHLGSSLVDNPSDSAECSSLKGKKSNSCKVDLEHDFLILNLSQKSSGCEQNSSGNTNSGASLLSSDSENASSVSGSLSSLRRRWAQSNAASLDATSHEDVNNPPGRRRTKLGMALLMDLSDSKDDKMENFLFNHTILIDSLMSKLRSSVESAYVKNQNFVHLLYTAFLDTQQNIYDFITSGKYAVPLWIALLGDTENDEPVGGSDAGIERDFKFSLRQLGSPMKIKKNWLDQESPVNAKIKFINDFYDVLVKFDTKDTNFFISTLLTAVLTHHLSWVTAIAETDASNRHEKVQSVIKNYNPIWAQLNDLCGLLGSPLKSAKTIVKGGETKKCFISAILHVLTYFIRCFNVVENIYDVNIEDIIGGVENSAEVANFQGTFNTFLENLTPLTGPVCDEKAKSREFYCGSETDQSVIPKKRNEFEGNSKWNNQEINFNPRLDLENTCRPEGSLKRNNKSSTHLNLEGSGKHYSSLRKMISPDKIDSSDVDKGEGEIVGGKLNGLTKFTGSSLKSHLEGYLSPDEGYDTIDSTKTDSLCTEKKELSVQSEPKESIVFLLGDNEKLVNLRKKVILTKPDVIEIEREDYKVWPSGERFRNEEKNVVDGEVDRDKYRTLSNVNDVGYNGENCLKEPQKTACHVPMNFLELAMPRLAVPSQKKHLEVSSVFGGVNHKYNSEQIIQGLVDVDPRWEENLQKDLFLCAYNSILEKDVSEALCIIGDVDSWEVSVRSSRTSSLDKTKPNGIRVGMSQLVADMLESFLHLRKFNLSPNFCLLHIEKKLREIYLKSKTVAELLISTDLCTIEYLTTRLDIGINDIPLLLSVATTHSPQISEKYGLSFT